jgi:hypothetical protein
MLQTQALSPSIASRLPKVHARANGVRQPICQLGVDVLTRLLLQVALLASANGIDRHAAPIRSVLDSMSLDRGRFHCTRALLLLQCEQAAAARDVIRAEVLPHAPGDELGHAVLARALHALRDPEWQAARGFVLATSTDELARRLVTSL